MFSTPLFYQFFAKQASELSKRGIFADESVKSKADELLKAKAKRLSDYYRSLL